MASPSQMQKMVESTKRRVDRKDLDFQKQISQSYFNAWNAVNKEMDALVKHIEAAKAAGVDTSPSWLAREQRYQSLSSRLYNAVQTFGKEIAEGMPKALMTNLEEGLKLTAGELAATGNPFSNGTWSVINAQAMTAAMALVNHEMSPLRALLLGDMPETAYSAFRKEFMNGMLLGRNPNRIAANIRRAVGTLTLGRAQLIARTEFHRAYRQGKVAQFEKLDVVDGWIWSAANDGRTCAVCHAMHGTFFPKNQTLAGHPGCRCVMVPHTKNWKDLGFDGLKDTRPVIEPGYKRFARLPADQQLRILGPSRFKMFQNGVPLSAMIARIDNPTWGRMYTLDRLRAVKPKAGGSSSTSGSQFHKDDYANPFHTNQISSTSATFSTLHNMVMTWGNAWGHLADLAQDWRRAIRTYQGTSYRDINAQLRAAKGVFANLPDWFTAGYLPTIQHLDEAFKVSRMGSAAILYRGTGYSAFGGSGEALMGKVGQTLTEHGYFSTATHNPFGGDVLMVIHAPKGTKAVWMSDRNTDPYNPTQPPKEGVFDNGENEVLLARGTKFRVDKVQVLDPVNQVGPHIGRYRHKVDVTIVGQA